jgi:hypothetical protein
MINLANIEYQSNNIIIIIGDERALILKVNTSPRSEQEGLNNTQYIYINTWYDGLTNSDIMEAIETLYNGEDDNFIYDEITRYQSSKLFQELINNE